MNDITIVLASVEIADDKDQTPYATTTVLRYDFEGNAEDLKKVIAAFPDLFIEGGQMNNTVES